MKIDSKSTIREKASRAFNFDQGSALDAVRRADYPTDDAYLDAAATYELARSTPEFQAARRKLQRELAEREEAAQREQQAAEFARLRASMKLSTHDQKSVDEKAAELAHRDLAAGRIGASGLGQAIEGHAKTLTDQRLDEKTCAALFNQILRSGR